MERVPRWFECTIAFDPAAVADPMVRARSVFHELGMVGVFLRDDERLAVGEVRALLVAVDGGVLGQRGDGMTAHFPPRAAIMLASATDALVELADDEGRTIAAEADLDRIDTRHARLLALPSRTVLVPSDPVGSASLGERGARVCIGDPRLALADLDRPVVGITSRADVLDVRMWWRGPQHDVQVVALRARTLGEVIRPEPIGGVLESVALRAQQALVDLLAQPDPLDESRSATMVATWGPPATVDGLRSLGGAWHPRIAVDAARVLGLPAVAIDVAEGRAEAPALDRPRRAPRVLAELRDEYLEASVGTADALSHDDPWSTLWRWVLVGIFVALVAAGGLVLPYVWRETPGGSMDPVGAALLVALIGAFATLAGVLLSSAFRRRRHGGRRPRGRHAADRDVADGTRVR